MIRIGLTRLAFVTGGGEVAGVTLEFLRCGSLKTARTQGKIEPLMMFRGDHRIA